MERLEIVGIFKGVYLQLLDSPIALMNANEKFKEAMEELKNVVHGKKVLGWFV